MAVISKVVAPSKPLQHTADLYIEAMEPVKKDDIASSRGNDAQAAADFEGTICRP